MDKSTLVSQVCPPLDISLFELLIDEYNSLEKRYILGDWEPATLDGGQFSEILSRIIYHIDSSNLNRTKGVNECLNYIESSTNPHNYPDRKSVLHLCRVIRFCYKFRSDRGAVHINPSFTANHIDSKILFESTKWMLSELLRVFWSGNRNLVESVIRNINEFNLPVIGEYGNTLLVQRTDCTTEEEIMILLHHIGNDGLNRTELGNHVQKSASAITKSLKKLSSNTHRFIIKLDNGNYRLTDIGTHFVNNELSQKLSL